MSLIRKPQPICMPRRLSYPYIRVTERWPNRKCPRSGGAAPLTFSSRTGLHLPDDELSPLREGDGGWFPRRAELALGHPVIPIEELLPPSADADRRQRPPDELVGLVPRSGFPDRPRTASRPCIA